MSTTTSVTPLLRCRRPMTDDDAAAATDSALRRLRLPTMRAVLGDAVTTAEKEQLSYIGFLAELLLAEVDDRDRRSTIRRVATAGFPRPKFLDDIDYDANPPLSPPPRSIPSRKAIGFVAATRSASSAIPAPGKAIC